MDRIEDTNRQRLCACGSGKKWKRCHNLIDAERERLTLIARREREARESKERTPSGAALSAIAMAATMGAK